MQGVVTFFVYRVLISAEAETETETPGLWGGGLAAQHPRGPYLICVDAPTARCDATQFAVFVSQTRLYTPAQTDGWDQHTGGGVVPKQPAAPGMQGDEKVEEGVKVL